MHILYSHLRTELCPVHVIDQSKQTVSDALKKSPVHVAFDTIGVGHRLSAVVRRGGWIIQAGEYRPSAALHARRRQDKLGRMCRRRGVRAATAQMDGRPELLRVARDVVDKVRVPHGPCFGVREYARAVAVAEEGVGSGMVVVLL